MMYSVLEQHNDGSWWYHPGFTHDTEEEAEEHFEKSFWYEKDRPHKIVGHTNPFPQDHSRCSQDCIFFGFGGITDFKLNPE